MTEEQARERAREWRKQLGLGVSVVGSCSADVLALSDSIDLSLEMLLLSVASEARQEERKRCEEIVRAHAWPEACRDELLRRIKGSE